MFFSLLTSGLVIGGVYGIIALGYALIYKASGLMSFAQGDILTLGAYLGYTFFVIVGLNFTVSFLITAVIMMVIGLLLERFIIRKMVDLKVNPFYIVIATVGLSYIIQNACQRIWGTVRIAFPSVFQSNRIKFLGRNIDPSYLLCLGITILIMVIFQIFLKGTKFGTAMRAASLDEKASRACGINVSRCTGVAWGIASCTAALAGILIAPVYALSSTLGSTLGTKGFAAAIIGGYGNFYGAVVGGFLLGIVEVFTAGYLSSAYKDIISYGLLLLFLFVKPFGIFNEKSLKD